LNLQYGGHHIAWLALPWSLDAFKQSCERVDRRGQTQNCYSHHILARDTIDQKVSDVLVQKNADQNRIIAAIRSL
jgi:SNF2 family DNA or RNA helicase